MFDTFIAEWSWKAPALPIDNWWFLGVVLVLLIFSIWVIARLTTSVNDDIDPSEIDRQMLTAVSELRSQGELSPDEYRSIKGRLVQRLNKQPSSVGPEGFNHKAQETKQTEGEPHSTTDKPQGTTLSATDSAEDSADSKQILQSSEKDQNDSA